MTTFSAWVKKTFPSNNGTKNVEKAPLLVRSTAQPEPPEHLIFRGVDTGVTKKGWDKSGSFVIAMLDRYGEDCWEQWKAAGNRFKEPLQSFFEKYFDGDKTKETK